MIADRENDKTINKKYLEIDLPKAIVEDINAYLKAVETNDLSKDCYWCELYGTINSFQVADLITKEQADYLRKKYLHIDVEKIKEEETMLRRKGRK